MAKILIVDDEQSIRFTLSLFLSEEGHEVDTAQDYQEALAKIDTGGFDLIIADILLGGKTGLDVLKYVRGKKSCCRVVIITGYPSVETAFEAESLDVFDYIPKPILKKDVLRVTEKALRHD